MPANARIAVSFSTGISAGDLTLAAGLATFGTPDLAADQVYRLSYVERAESVVPTCAVAGTVTLYVLNEWMLSDAIATGVFT